MASPNPKSEVPVLALGVFCAVVLSMIATLLAIHETQVRIIREIQSACHAEATVEKGGKG